MPEINISPVDDDAVLREVWNIENVGAKTELDDNQIATSTKLRTMADIFGNSVLDEHLVNFMIYQKSRARQSMKEFVDVVRAKREDFVDKGKGFFSSMLG